MDTKEYKDFFNKKNKKCYIKNGTIPDLNVSKHFSYNFPPYLNPILIFLIVLG
jgi:hypothetical protein